MILTFCFALLLFFNQKNISIFCNISFQTFNEILTNDVVNFEQPAPDIHTRTMSNNLTNDEKCRKYV